VEELWDSTHITDSSWIAKIGCNADEHPAYAEGGAWCFLSQLRKLSVMASCMLLVPIAVQVCMYVCMYVCVCVYIYILCVSVSVSVSVCM
jgi:hypothetical protein